MGKASSSFYHRNDNSDFNLNDLMEVAPRHLVFDCVIVGQTSKRTLLVKNYSEHHVLFMITTNTPAFSIKEKNEEPHNVLPYTLGPRGTLNLEVIFTPTYRAPFRGEIVFTYLTYQKQQPMQSIRIPVYGYGGTALIEFYHANLLQPSSGIMTFNVGVVSRNSTLVKNSIMWWNSGNRFGFVYARFEENTLPFRVFVHNTPTKFIIKPGEEVSMSITYEACDNDLKYFAEAGRTIFLLGAIKLYMGTDVLRRRLINIAKHCGCPQLPVPLNGLTGRFSYDAGAPAHREGFEEDVRVMDQLLDDVIQKEIFVIVKFDSSTQVF